MSGSASVRCRCTVRMCVIFESISACVSLCKNVINPCSVSFSARHGKIEAEYLFTAHPFKTRGLFLFVQPERRQGM